MHRIWRKLSKIVFLLLFVNVIEHVCAQNGRLFFSVYSDYLSKVYDISWKRPKGFTDLHTSIYWSPCGKKSSTLSYNFIFRSKDADCMIMYPEIGLTYFPKNKIKMINIKRLIYGDLGCIGKDGILQESAVREFEERVIILSSDDAKKFFNADLFMFAQFLWNNLIRESIHIVLEFTFPNRTVRTCTLNASLPREGSKKKMSIWVSYIRLSDIVMRIGRMMTKNMYRKTISYI